MLAQWFIEDVEFGVNDLFDENVTKIDFALKNA